MRSVIVCTNGLDTVSIHLPQGKKFNIRRKSMPTVIAIIIAVAALVVGILLGVFLQKSKEKKQP